MPSSRAASAPRCRPPVRPTRRSCRTGCWPTCSAFFCPSPRDRAPLVQHMQRMRQAGRQAESSRDVDLRLTARERYRQRVPHHPTGREPLLLLIVGLALLVLSGIGPHDRATWWLEVAPILIAVPILAATARRFPLTPLAYRLIFVHALILMVGGHYTYAEVPAGFWLKDA